jgi:signal transduction histidine kinase
LGLSVCHGIITEHGGKIYAKIKPGKGTIFFVELPIRSKILINAALDPVTLVEKG